MDAVEERLLALAAEMPNQPRMNTDEHGWESRDSVAVVKRSDTTGGPVLRPGPADVDAVEERLLMLAAGMPDQPRMNTDAHGWDVVRQTPRHEGAGELARNGSPISLSDPCSIRVSSVAQNPPVSRARTSLTMIVRDEQENLPRCLSSVAGLFDEVVVVDTGSTDRTREIALEFGTGCSISSGSMTSPRRGMRPWRGPRAIMPSGRSTRPPAGRLPADGRGPRAGGAPGCFGSSSITRRSRAPASSRCPARGSRTAVAKVLARGSVGLSVIGIVRPHLRAGGNGRPGWRPAPAITGLNSGPVRFLPNRGSPRYHERSLSADAPRPSLRRGQGVPT